VVNYVLRSSITYALLFRINPIGCMSKPVYPVLSQSPRRGICREIIYPNMVTAADMAYVVNVVNVDYVVNVVNVD
jgi:hypothetical protein